MKFNDEKARKRAAKYFQATDGRYSLARIRFLDTIRTTHKYEAGRVIVYYLPSGNITHNMKYAESLWKRAAGV